MAQNYTAGQRDDAEMHEELKAVLHASRELPSQMDDSVIDAFMERLDRHIDSRLGQPGTVTPSAPFVVPNTQHQSRSAAKRADAGNVSAILGVGIPFVVLAGVFGHTAGVVLAVIVIGLLAAAQIARESIG
ncbi:MAG: hypothetical protein ACYDCQ_03120 [Dehalococcoidia bacterium]